MSSLIHLIYASAASDAQTSASLDAILSVACARNARNGVTGMLLYAEGSFFQVLEGPEAAVDETFLRIDGDSRHRNTTCIIREPIARRAFRDWSMGYASMSPADLSTVVGVNDFFGAGQVLQELTPGRARKLLVAFGGGRWRAAIRTPAFA